MSLVLLVLAGCGAKNVGDEPPLSLGEGKPGAMVRSADLLAMQDGAIIYNVSYPAFDLKSKVTIDLVYKTMTREVFPGKWVVVYDYTDTMSKFSKMPNKITIYTDGGDGKEGKKINEYKFDSFQTNKGGAFKGEDGKEKTIEFTYFDGISGG